MALEAAHAEVRAGVAEIIFALPDKVPLAGYSRRHGKPSTGIHDPVGVRALVLQDGDTVAALVSCDLLIIDERLFEAVRRRLHDAGFSGPMTLLLAATHTHSGPGAYGTKFFEKLSMGHFDPRVFNVLVETIAETIARASRDVAPVRVASAAAATDGLIQNRVEVDGPVDRDVTVVGLYRPDGRDPMAVVVSFAAHPTTLGAWNTRLSADYPGVLRQAIEQRWPQATAFFVAGAVGDQAPVKSGEGFERAERIGRPLADRAIAALSGAAPGDAGHLLAAQTRMPLPPAHVRLGRFTVPRWLGARFVDDDATLTVLAVGRAAFFGAPCDLAAGLGEALKASARARGLEPVIVGFANDYIGYCVPERLYDQKAYESSLAFNGPKTGKLVVEGLQRLLDDILSDK
ncbi:MAG: neutral/alkaline non-lysosomal ceramidase N-terminal domain-containing protein [Candidatus Omnitrophica bacterium]|nr:neutral/alkaline non-lysosomal ceramidase N-terminal domain-containing protein [Candidatus Omnitrophota bacterium]